MPENTVVRLWLQAASGQTCFRDVNGQLLKLVYPGRPNDRRGGDFRDAVIITPDGCQMGCIEIHTLTSGWQSHGHHLDPYYNQVVLQVAWQSDRGVPACSAAGRCVPTVLLADQAALPPSAGLACRQTLTRLSPARLAEILHKAGENRFRQKSQVYSSALAEQPAREVLFHGLSQALGYSHNQSAFEALTRGVPLGRYYHDLGLTAENPRQGGYFTGIQSRLIQCYWSGRAGLLPSQRGMAGAPDEYMREMEQIWHSSGWTSLSPAPAWDFYRVRPLNNPVRRLMALCGWLEQERFRYWQPLFLEPVRCHPPRTAIQMLYANLAVPGSDYWALHYDFGRLIKSPQSALIGNSRLGEMLVNVLLPFLLAWAYSQADEILAGRLMVLFRQHPALAVNSIQRHMSAQLGLSAGFLNSACRQQGVIYIFKTFCREGRCAECPLCVQA